MVAVDESQQQEEEEWQVKYQQLAPHYKGSGGTALLIMPRVKPCSKSMSAVIMCACPSVSFNHSEVM